MTVSLLREFSQKAHLIFYVEQQIVFFLAGLCFIWSLKQKHCCAFSQRIRREGWNLSYVSAVNMKLPAAILASQHMENGNNSPGSVQVNPSEAQQCNCHILLDKWKFYGISYSYLTIFSSNLFSNSSPWRAWGVLSCVQICLTHQFMFLSSLTWAWTHSFSLTNFCNTELQSKFMATLFSDMNIYLYILNVYT